MKKLLHTVTFIGKALLLIILLLVGWIFINATNLIKGKKTALNNQKATDNPLDFNWAHADSTPFIAIYDGAQYRLENDFLFGKPSSYFADQTIGKKAYLEQKITPDLYKIQKSPTPKDGKLLMQVQEIEPEESFIGNLALERIIHPEDTEILTDANLNTYWILRRTVFEKAIALPKRYGRTNSENEHISSPSLIWQSNIKEDPHLFFSEPGESRTFSFRGLNPKEKTYLVVKSRYRDYVNNPPEKLEKITFKNFFSAIAPRIRSAAAAGIILLVGIWLQKKLPGVNLIYTTIPVFFGVQGACCFVYEYRTGNQYRPIGIHSVRAWQYNTELIEIPRGAIGANGKVEIKLTAAKRHALGFVGVIQNESIAAASVAPIRKEEIFPSRAYHHRLKKEAAGTLKKSRGNELLHAIPGDIIDIEFEAPEKKLKKHEKETYLLRASGFYTHLTEEGAARAGNWKEHLSEEAKIHNQRLTELRSYR